MKTYNIDIYGKKVILTKTAKDFDKRCKKLKVYGLEGQSAGGAMNYSYETKTFIIGVFSKDSGILMHEINHLCIKLFDLIGSPISHDNSEPFCYLSQHLFYEFNKYYKTS